MAVFGSDVCTHSRPSIKTVFCMPEVGMGVHASDLMAVDLREAVRVDASDVWRMLTHLFARSCLRRVSCDESI
jgi:hypothetical protein